MTQYSEEAQDQQSQTFDDIAALLLAPLLVTSAESIEQPAVRDLIKAVIALQERGKEALAQLEEAIEDLRAEVEAELAQEQKTDSDPKQAAHIRNPEDSVLAQVILTGVSEVDAAVRKATQGNIDARALTSLLFAALALRQLIVKGLQIDDVPWYVLAWYAFDSFLKFHPRQPALSKDNAPVSPEHNGNAASPVQDSTE